MNRRTYLQRAYTLIELMTVMAITAILLTIIVYPVFQVFAFTRQAQSFSDAQFRAKQIADRIGAEIGNNAGVRDMTANHGRFKIDVQRTDSTSYAPALDAQVNGLVVPVPGSADVLMDSGWGSSWNGSKASPATLSYAMIDIYKAAQDGSTGAGGGFINPATGKEDPTLTEPKGQVMLPVTSGRTLIRYAVTLRDPFSPYNNTYDGVLMKAIGGRDNLYVLRRFEVPLYVTTSAGKSVVNKMAFIDLGRVSNDATHTKKFHRTRLKVAGSSGPLLDDPFFMDPYHSLEGIDAANATSGGPFGNILNWSDTTHSIITYDDPDTVNPAPDPTKAEMITYWLKHSTIVTEISRYDMIQAEYDRKSKAITYLGNSPQVFPLVQFRPTRVSSEPAVGQTAVRAGQEADNAALIGPEVYRTEKGMWSNPVVRLYPNGWETAACPVSTSSESLANDAKHRYTIARPDATGSRDSLSLYVYNPVSEGCPEANMGIEVFDLGVYGQGGPYPFTAALAAANSRSGWASGSDAQKVKNSFAGFDVATAQGYIRSSFEISEVGDSTQTPAIDGNLPSSTIANTSTPTTDGDPTNASTHPYSGASYDINACFNRMWDDPATSFLKPDIHRFLDLRVTAQSDGTPSPLDPTIGFAKAYIVPGSEEIWGPDQLPGANYGNPVRYYRVTRNPGPNQYRINYTDQTEPTDYTLLGFASSTPPSTYTPTDVLSAVIQPRYKRGYVQFNSDPNTPLPAGTITVRYRFQFTMPGDVVAVDYDTREVMSVLITVKNFPQSSLSQAQTVTVPATAKVRYVLK